MTRKELLTGAAGGVAAAVILTFGHLAAAAENHVVNTPTPAPAAVAPPSFADIVQRVSPAVVSIEIEGKVTPQDAAFQGGPQMGPQDGPQGGPQIDPFNEQDPFGALRQFFQQQQPQKPVPLRAAGSGFFISQNGYIVTNNHVVQDADKITVKTSDGQTLKAKLVGRDPATDLAVIKVEGDNHPFVSFEDRAKPRVGDWVVAVGNPFDLGETATAGIVSALSRPNVSGSSYVDYMQIDAPINRGNSGGPSFDVYGRVVGVNSAIFTPSGGSVGIGFDIPADVASRVTKQLISYGKVTRGYIGAEIQDITPDIAASLGIAAHQGALVADVTPDGPSAHAGLQSGDIIERIDGRPITSASDLTRQVGLVRPGEEIHLQVGRDGHMQQVTLRSGVRPSEQALADNDQTGPMPGHGEGALGLMVSPKAGGGLTIQGVNPDSDAADKGVRPGDVIEQVNGHPVNSPADVHQAIKAARAAGRDSVLVRLAHGGQHLFVPLDIGKAPAGKG